MELLYLWIEDYNNIQNQGFNFSSKWKFDYQNEQLTVEERPNAIDNFLGRVLLILRLWLELMVVVRLVFWSFCMIVFFQMIMM